MQLDGNRLPKSFLIKEERFGMFWVVSYGTCFFFLLDCFTQSCEADDVRQLFALIQRLREQHGFADKFVANRSADVESEYESEDCDEGSQADGSEAEPAEEAPLDDSGAGCSKDKAEEPAPLPKDDSKTCGKIIEVEDDVEILSTTAAAPVVAQPRPSLFRELAILQKQISELQARI